MSSPAEVDLTGEWIGHYPGHHDEVIRVHRETARWVATKVTGDSYVPAGEVTWRADIATGIGEGQIAGVEFRAARFVPGRLEIIAADRIVFRWRDLGEVTYRRDD
ncbi:MAG: DUF3506 domain-containing protein [Verrucomicrobia bacterium]|nr:DUF3506 domain-containing protein [Verrucomicrobiota bacterium]